jgi:rhomboid protease GluP
VSRAILALNVVVFVVQVVLAGKSSLLQIPTRESLLFGANYAAATIGEHRFETLLTSCFLHGGMLHIGFNMLVLWQAGPLVERSVGSARMAPMYLVSGVVASLFSAMSSWVRGVEIYSVGASGAIMGVLASALVLAWRVQGFRGPVTMAMLRWLGFNLLFGIVLEMMASRDGGHAPIDNFAHVGGAITGGVIAALWQRGYVYSPRARTIILSVCGLLFLAAAGTVAARDLTDPYAAMMVGDRINVEKIALFDGRCTDAEDAVAAAARLYPKSRDVLLEEAKVASVCGGK